MKIKSEKLSQSGAVAMEFALVLPVLLLILFGIIEFSILFYNKAVITNASREGARYGITFITDPGALQGTHPTQAQIIARVDDYLRTASGNTMLITFGTENIGTVAAGAAGASGTDLTVTVTYDYDFLILPNFADIAVGLILTAETVMRLE